MGHVFFSARLLAHMRPRAVFSVALVAQDDSALRPLLEAERRTKLLVCPDLPTEEVEAGGGLLDEQAGESPRKNKKPARCAGFLQF